MRRPPNIPSPLWLWWRRQSFYFRRLRCKWCVFLCICIPFLFIIPNPFSSQYAKIPINQDVQWSSISELLQKKATVDIFFFFNIKFYDGILDY